MPYQTPEAARYDAMGDSFIKAVEESRGGIPEERLAESIDHLVLIFGVFYAQFEIRDGATAPSYPSVEEMNRKTLNPGILREPFSEQCESLGRALAINHPDASTRLFELAECFEEYGIDRMHEIWPTVQATLKCVLAQLQVKSTDEHGKPRLSDRQREVREIIREHGPIKEKEIEEKLSLVVGSGTIRKWDLPVLKEHYGVARSKDGFYIE